jgi:P27 family predicted phage terminase small subunit
MLEGTYRADRHGNAVKALSEPPAIPNRFKKSPRMRAVWKELIMDLGPGNLDILHKGDRKVLEMLVDCYDEWIRLGEEVEAKGFTYESFTENGTIIRPLPEVAMRADAFRRMKSLITELGMTPASRNKVSAAAQAEADPYTDAKKKAW